MWVKHVAWTTETAEIDPKITHNTTDLGLIQTLTYLLTFYQEVRNYILMQSDQSLVPRSVFEPELVPNRKHRLHMIMVMMTIGILITIIITLINIYV